MYVVWSVNIVLITKADNQSSL